MQIDPVGDTQFIAGNGKNRENNVGPDVQTEIGRGWCCVQKCFSSAKRKTNKILVEQSRKEEADNC